MPIPTPNLSTQSTANSFRQPLPPQANQPPIQKQPLPPQHPDPKIPQPMHFRQVVQNNDAPPQKKAKMERPICDCKLPCGVVRSKADNCLKFNCGQTIYNYQYRGKQCRVVLNIPADEEPNFIHLLNCCFLRK